MTVAFEYLFEFSNNSKKMCFFFEYCECLKADSEGCGCGIDMVDGTSETLETAFFKRNMIEFSSNVIGR